MSNWNSIASFPEKNTCVRALECKWNGRHTTLLTWISDSRFITVKRWTHASLDYQRIEFSSNTCFHIIAPVAIEDFKILMCKLQVNARSMTQFAVVANGVPLSRFEPRIIQSSVVHLFWTFPQTSNFPWHFATEKKKKNNLLAPLEHQPRALLSAAEHPSWWRASSTTTHSITFNDCPAACLPTHHHRRKFSPSSINRYSASERSTTVCTNQGLMKWRNGQETSRATTH